MFYILLAAAISAVIYYILKTATYWKREGVPQGSLLFVLTEMLLFVVQKRNFGEAVLSYYNMFPGTRYSGVYNLALPVLMIKDPDLIKEITVKSFDHFPDHNNILLDSDTEPLWNKNLFILKGQKWRNMRPILSPSFTSSKIRSMFLLMSECAENFCKYYLNKNEKVVEIELKNSFTRFANDVIATTAFGIKTDSLKDQENVFYLMGKKLSSFTSGLLNGLKFFCIIIFPNISKKLNFGLFDKKVSAYFMDLIETTIKTRKEKGIVRPDMIHLLLEAQKGLEIKEAEVEQSSFAEQKEADLGKVEQTEMTNLDITAQALVFFLAGFETISSSLCFMAYELAVNPDIQQRLRDEIVKTLEDCQGKLTYEALLKMKYMDMVVSESLRKWSTVAFLDRVCTKPYTIKPELPGEKPLHLKERSIIWIPVYAIHRNPNIYPEPDKFDPERFNDENKGNIHPYSYFPFGLGPRNCIGSRFALVEMKTVFFHLLKKFKIVPTKKSSIPLQLAGGFNMTSKGGFWFGLQELKQ